MTDSTDDYDRDQWGIAVVILLTDTDGIHRPTSGQTPIDLSQAGEIPPETLTELLESTVRLTATEDIPAEIINILDATPVPPAWRSSSWLRHHRPLIVKNGLAAVGEFTLGYQRHLGIYLDTDA